MYTSRSVCCSASGIQAESLPSCPQLILGDLNAEPKDLATFSKHPSAKKWIDLGTVADKWGGILEAPTSRAQEHGEPYRRGIVLANENGINLVRDFEV